MTVYLLVFAVNFLIMACWGMFWFGFYRKKYALINHARFARLAALEREWEQFTIQERGSASATPSKDDDEPLISPSAAPLGACITAGFRTVVGIGIWFCGPTKMENTHEE